MILGNCSPVLSRTTGKSFFVIIIIAMLAVLGLSTDASALATVATDTTEYWLGDNVDISGVEFWESENIFVRVNELDGTLITSWNVTCDTQGDFITDWTVPLDGSSGDTLTITATGQSSDLIAATTIVLPPTSLQQLQNGTSTAAANWSSGNINTSNSCFSEGGAIPYRFFVKEEAAGTQHYFTIECQSTKLGYHAFDYFANYDLSELSPITAAGGPCGDISTSPPDDCGDPTNAFLFPDPTDSTNYLYVPAEMVPLVSGSFSIDEPRYLKSYNAVVDSVSKYQFLGTTANHDLQVTVYFTIIDDGSAGFFWGGHLSEGTDDTWGAGAGTGSIPGNLMHMRTLAYDGGGQASQDKSAHSAAVCAPPAASISFTAIDSMCQDSAITFTAIDSADIYDWTVTGGTIVSGQGTNEITVQITGTPGSYLEVSLSACNSSSGCPDDYCCASDEASIYIGDCASCEITLTCPDDVTIECDQSTDPSNTGTATFTSSGNCPALYLHYADEVTAGSCDQQEVVTRTWAVSNEPSRCIDTLAVCQQTINVVDTTPPVFVQACPTDVTVECDAVPAAATLTATDNCDPAPTVTFTESSVPGACAQEETITRTWVTTDACGNADSCVQVITVTDNTAPVFDQAAPADITVECDAIPAAATLTATDNCDLSPSVVFSESSTAGACPQEEIITRTWTATDACGNVTLASQTITVVDTTPPTFDQGCPADMTVACSNVPLPVTLTATDNCDAAPTVAYSETTTPGACAYEQTITRTWVATDACGNANTCVQIVTVVDIVLPVFDQTCPADVTVECDNIPTAATLTATDNCDPAPVVTFSENSTPGACDQEEIITRTWTATDACGNVETCTQTITVIDTTPPVFDQPCPSDLTVECGNVPTAASLTATDNCDLNPTVTFSETTVPGACAQEEIITRTWVTADACGNADTCTQVITVEDTTPPVFDQTCPADITAECDNIPTAAILTATDNCDPAPTVTPAENTTPGANPGEYILTRTWVATDACGNAVTCSQDITVTDTTPPTFDQTCPADVTVECDAIPAAATLTASDNCDAGPTVTFSESSVTGSCPQEATITRMWVAADISGNADTCTQVITVVDTTPPVFVQSPPTVLSAECDNVPAPAAVSATDICDPAPVVTFSESSTPGSCDHEYTITRTWTATDACGNFVTTTQVIDVSDNTPPVFDQACPNNSIVDCDAIPTAPTMTATDNCDPGPTVAFTETSTPGACPQEQTITREWIATDVCGNADTCTQVLSVKDAVAPIFDQVCPADITVECGNVPTAPTLTATDNCDPAPVVTFGESTAPGTCPQEQRITRTWVATDACGNAETCTQTITVKDTTPPVFDQACPSDMAVECGNVPAAATLTATDNCDAAPVVTFSESAVPGSCPQQYDLVRTWYAQDACGNIDSCVQTVTVDDTQAPVISQCAQDLILQTTSGVPDCDPGDIAATDNCGNVTITCDRTDNGGTACPGDPLIYTDTYTATDECGNSAQCSRTITIADTTPPTITSCPDNLTLPCIVDIPDCDPADVVASDNTGNVTVTCDRTDNGGSGSNGDPLVITDTYTAVDGCGSTAQCSRTITVEDTTPPEITSCPGDLSFQCVADIPDCDPNDVVASDNCGDVTIICDRTDNGGIGCPGDPLVVTDTYIVDDGNGNTAQCSRTITAIDDTPPVIEYSPPDITVQGIADVPDCDPNEVIASDNCRDSIVLCDRDYARDASGTGCSDDPLIITDTYTALDWCGNSSQATRVITVMDTEPPVCFLPNDTTIILCDTATICLPVTAEDNVDTDVTCEVVSGGGTIADGQWCYVTPGGDEVITVEVRCFDDCDNECTGSFTVTFAVNTRPELTIVPPDPVTLCQASSTVCVDMDIIDQDNGLSGVSQIGWVDLSDSTVCFMADTAGLYTNMVIITDSCGLADTAVYSIEVGVCEPVNLGSDIAVDHFFLCDSVTATVPVPPVIGGCGPFVWKVNGADFDPATPITYHIPPCGSFAETWTYSVTDVCGRSDQMVVSAAAVVNCPPTVTISGYSGLVLCEPEEFCNLIGYVASDPDNNIESVELLPGTHNGYLSGNHICFTPTETGIYEFIVKVTDECGVQALDTFNLPVEFPPVVEVADATHDFFLCEPGSITAPLPLIVSGSPDVWWIWEGGDIMADSFSLETPASGSYVNLLIATDGCTTDTAVVTVNVTINEKPTVSVNAPDTIWACGFPKSVCVQLDVFDPDDGLTATSQIGTANLALGTVCFQAEQAGHYCDRVIVTDGCNLSDTVDYCVDVVFDESCNCPSIVIEKTHKSYQGMYETVSVFVENLTFEIGGFDFLIQYDPSALSFSYAEQGEVLINCEWEYFTYRYGAGGNCGGNACPTGIVRILAIAEMVNGPLHPSCYGPPDSEMHELAQMRFLVTNDRTFECMYVPIRFIWYDCGDNTLSGTDGETLYLSSDVYDYNNPNPITDINAPFPSTFGANGSCDVHLDDGKPDPVRCSDYYNGGVDIVCADSIDARADINLNEVPYEIADVVLYANYFVYGISVFVINVEGQIAASDVNADGLTLSVADLVYMVRVIVGDAEPYVKLAPVEAAVTYDGSTLAVSEAMGAAHILVRGDHVPHLLATNMEMKYDYDASADLTRIIVFSLEADRTFTGDFLTVGGDLVNVELATYAGAPVSWKLLPREYALYQNFPNPFNAVTTLSFDMAKAGEYELTVYNVSGQQVARFTGHSRPGTVDVAWDASDVASGVYLYRLRTAEFSDVKKMILLK